MEVVEALTDPSNPAYHLIVTWDSAKVHVRSAGRRSRPQRPYKAQFRLDTESINKLVATYQAGATQKELAATFCIDKKTVASHLKRAGVHRPRVGLPDDKLAEAIRLYRNGRSLAELGERFGVDPKTASTALRQAGITIRPRRGWA